MSGRKPGRRRQRTVVSDEDLTAFGRWVRTQPRGTLSRAMASTGLAYTTVLYAKTRLVTREVAEALSAFTRGEVAADDLARPTPYGRAA